MREKAIIKVKYERIKKKKQLNTQIKQQKEFIPSNSERIEDVTQN